MRGGEEGIWMKNNQQAVSWQKQREEPIVKLSLCMCVHTRVHAGMVEARRGYCLSSPITLSLTLILEVLIHLDWQASKI